VTTGAATTPPGAPTGAGATILRLRDVAVRYIVRGRIFSRGPGDRWALGGVSFELKAGETLGVVGRNGAGKTTLLRLLAGILGPDRGIVERRPGVRASLLSLQVGFLPQLTGRENATLSGMLLGLRRAELEARLASIVHFAELAGVMDDPISTWSDASAFRSPTMPTPSCCCSTKCSAPETRAFTRNRPPRSASASVRIEPACSSPTT
jgi:hypothetical protein